MPKIYVNLGPACMEKIFPGRRVTRLPDPGRSSFSYILISLQNLANRLQKVGSAERVTRLGG